MKKTALFLLSIIIAMTTVAQNVKTNETTTSKGLSKEEQQVIAWIDAHMPQAIELLKESVNINSGTLNIEGVKKVGALFAKEFEKAGEIKKRLFSLEHINDVALIKGDYLVSVQNFRIEAYDIAHMFGSNMVGVMTVIENGQLAKNEYKKFIIRTQTSSNDTGALEEVLSRRLRHVEWGLPSLIVMDGSIAQINVAKTVLNRYQYKIPVVSVIKDDKHKAKAIIGDQSIIKKYKKDIIFALCVLCGYCLF